MIKISSFQKPQLVKANPKEAMRGDLYLVLLLLAFSGNPALYCQPFIDVMLVGLAIFLTILIQRHNIKITTRKLFFIAVLFGFILLVQCISFSFYPIVTMCGFYTRLFIGYIILRLVKNFPFVYVRAMFLLAIVSLMFYIPREISLILGFDFAEWFAPLANIIDDSGSMRYKLIFHTYLLQPIHLHRNCGMFWEPTAFAGYLILALVLLAAIKKEMSKRNYRRYLIGLSAVLLTTLSTTGFITFPLILILHYDWQVRIRSDIFERVLLGMYVILPLLIGICIYVYTKSEFLQAKIVHQFYEAKYQDTAGWHQGRLGSLFFDWEYIKRRPFTGWGLHKNTRYTLNPEFEEIPVGMGNGMSDFIAQFGISGTFIWLFSVFQGMMRVTKRNIWQSFLVILIVLSVLQGECFLNYPLFLSLMFLG